MTSPIRVEPQAYYIADQSNPANHCYVFAYRIQIHNDGDVGVQLISRSWYITDANNHVREVHGEGVVGEQPHLQPGETYEYVSGAVLATAQGTMRGSYNFTADDGREFEAPVPEFLLNGAQALH